MRFCPIASGSSGNCIYVGNDRHSLLIDAGISGKRIEAGLGQIDRTGKDIDGILITHEHSDHIKGIGILARRYEMPVYMTQGTADALREITSVGKIPNDLIRVIKAGEDFEVGSLRVHPFTVSHDAAEPVGYRIASDGKSCAVATDMGIYTEDTVRELSGLSVLLLESNHDLHMLQAGRYPYYLKRRIMGEKGHLSNDDAGRLLCRVLHEDMQKIYLGHLSRENNYEDLAFETVCQEVTLGDNPYNASDFAISIAHRDDVSDMVDF